MVEKTVFHRILDRELPAEVVYEDSEVLAFKDIHPKAPLHILFVPRVFASSVKELSKETEYLPGLLILKAKKFAEERGIRGYKLTFHVGREGGQEVDYLHLHFLAQQELEEGR